MAIYKEKIIDVATGEESWRDYTPEEIATVEAEKAKTEAKQLAEADRVAARQAIFDRLGITAEEAAVLGL